MRTRSDRSPLADLVSTLLRALRLLTRPFRLVDPRAQNLHRLCTVLVLRFLVLAGHDDARGQVADPHRAIGGIHVLAASTLRAVGLDAQVLVIDHDVDLLGLGQDRNRGGAGVYAS